MQGVSAHIDRRSPCFSPWGAFFLSTVLLYVQTLTIRI
jgi:hypothetical protein